MLQVLQSREDECSRTSGGNVQVKYRIYAQRVYSFRWSESVSFYKDTIGFPVKFENEEMGWAEFDLGGASLAVERQNKDDPEQGCGICQPTGETALGRSTCALQ